MPNKNYKTLELPAGYKPKMSEPYMSLEQKAFFYKLLTAQKQELFEEENELKHDAAVLNMEKATGDLEDTAESEIELGLTITTANRTFNLMKKYDEALKRLEEGTYGYSRLSGDEIGIKRLMARPIVSLTIAEQEAKEKNE